MPCERYRSAVIDKPVQLGYNLSNNMLRSPDQDMNGNNPDSNKRPHPSAKDPLEVRIRGLIRDQAYSDSQGEKMWGESRKIQIAYFQDALVHLDNPKYVHDKTQEALEKIARSTNAHIVSGKENVTGLKTPALIILNHYSGYKLTALKHEELDADFGDMEELYPFPSFFAPMVPVAKAVGEDVALYDAHLEYSDIEKSLPLRKVQEEAGLLVIPEDGGNFTSTLEATRKLTKEKPRSLLVVFPEGESSGKRNNGGPYDMVEFHTGSFVIAAELGMPIVPAVQYFNAEKGFQVAVLPPLTDIKVFPKESDGKPTLESKEYYANLTSSTHDAMQKALNALTGKASADR